MTGKELIYKVYDYIEKMINDEYDLIKFQADFLRFVHENYDEIEAECYEVARLLDDDFQDCYEVVEWYDDKSIRICCECFFVIKSYGKW